MKRLLTVVVAALLLLLPAAVFAQYDSRTKDAAPISQTLVREGDLAVRLAGALKIAHAGNEAEAVGLLTKAGIAPKNGWISDYPVTPVVMAEVQTSLDKATTDGRIAMRSDEADNALYAVADDLGIPIRAGEAVDEGQPRTEPEEYSNPADIENYYEDEGPPVVTYFAPPWDYYYLYDWTPYPFWWDSFWFPGFFVLRDFSLNVVVINGRCFIAHAGTVVINGSTVVISSGATTRILTNTVLDPRTHTFAKVDPASGGFVRTGASGTSSGGSRHAWTGDSRKSAQSIVSHSQSHAVTGGHPTFANTRSVVGRGNKGLTSGTTGASRRDTWTSGRDAATGVRVDRGSASIQRHSDWAGGSFNRQSVSAPSAPSRGFEGGGGRSFSAPSAPSRGLDRPTGGGGGGGGHSFGGCRGGRC